jgi:hypothetical protein
MAVVVCASASCPNLRPEAFVTSKLKEQMEDQMRLWMKETIEQYVTERVSKTRVLTSWPGQQQAKQFIDY